MTRWKRGVALLLVAAMTCSIAGCGSKKEESATEVTTEAETTEEAKEDVTTEEETTQEIVSTDGNMIRNGDFSNGVGNFASYTNGGQMTMDVNDDGELQIDIAKTGSVEHGVQVYYDGFEMREGGVYTFSFDVHSTVERDIAWRVQVNGGDYHAYATEVVSVGPDVQHVESEFTMEEATDPAPRLCFNLGLLQSMKDAGMDGSSLGEHSIYLDNLSLTVKDDSQMAADTEEVEVPKVKVNQLGYTTGDKKTVIFSDLDEDDTTFQVVNVDTNQSVYDGKISERKINVTANEWNNNGDFTDVKEKGTYKIVTGKGEESYPFAIGDNIYDDTFKSIVKMLYLQRCGMELTSDKAGDFAHPVCHNTQATVYGTSQKVDVSGGWHDAGDYGRYVVSGAKTVADLLLAFEKQGGKIHAKDADNYDIPESGNGVNDLIDEARYELDWLLKMQDSSGGVYHKVTCKVFPETVMPQDETDELILSPISNTATGDFAAVMALASRIYTEYGDSSDKAYAKTCLDAAKKAWTYLEKNKDAAGFKNPEDIVTGEYPDGRSTDEMFWAAAELYKTTGEDTYKSAMGEYTSDTANMTGLGWASVGTYGAYAALTTDKLKTDSSNLTRDIQNALIAAADEAVATSQKNGYMINKDRKYEWGSNMGIANTGMLLLLANDISPKEEYVTYAKQHLNYLMGMNPTGYCFVTGCGTLSPEHPHHRPSEVLEKCMPGMLVGGPDNNMDDPYAKAVFLNTAPAKCYVDNAQSYSTNEVAIYWNSPLIYLMVASQK